MVNIAGVSVELNANASFCRVNRHFVTIRCHELSKMKGRNICNVTILYEGPRLGMFCFLLVLTRYYIELVSQFQLQLTSP
jgi:hypothetical protein